MATDPRIAALADRNGGTTGLVFREGSGGLVFVDVANRHASASVCLQGAQLIHWQPHDQIHPVLWLSAGARYEPGKAIRGGIPVCWPWFGAAVAGCAQPAAAGPAHGFARTQTWQFDAAQNLADGATRLCLRLADNAQTRQLWPAAFDLALRITVGASLELELTSRNTGSATVLITEALHTYFQVGDIEAVAVHGLAGARFVDSVALAAAGAGAAPDADRTHAYAHDGAVRFAGELDRVYDTPGDCRIDDPVLGRSLHIAKSGSASTVVWNPWQAKAERLGDIVPGGWRQMVCVESGNAGANTVRLAAGASHCLTTRYRILG
jgi:D-hexose-6-phosphate mutarotase